MYALAALVVASTPTFEELSKKNLDPFALTKTGTSEYRIRFEVADQPTAVGITLRYSKGAKGTVFEGLRDGKKILRVMNDGKSVAVQATGAGLQCLVPASTKRPIDVSFLRFRPKGKELEISFLGEPTGDQFKGYVWKNTIDEADVIDGVDCRHLGYVGKRADAVDVVAECWLDKKTSEFKFMRYKFGEGSFTVGTSFSPSPLALPLMPLAKATFKGYDSVPLSIVREKAAAMWAPAETATSKDW